MVRRLFDSLWSQTGGLRSFDNPVRRQHIPVLVPKAFLLTTLNYDSIPGRLSFEAEKSRERKLARHW